jgi:prevent-host-death family protein
MSEAIVTVEDAAARLDELVERVYGKRETTVIVKGGRPLARIVPLPALGEVSNDLLDFLRRWRTEHPEPDEQFADAVTESRRSVQPARDSWE